MAEAAPETFADILRETIAHRHLSARQVAAYAGVAPTSVTMWLRGAVVPRPDTLRKLADGMQLPYRRLMVAAGHWSEVEPEPVTQTPTERMFASGTLPQNREEAIRMLAELALGSGQAVEITSPIRMIPVQDSHLHAGEGSLDVRFVPIPAHIAGPNTRAYYLRGSCMEPELMPGDIIYVDIDQSPKDRGIVAVELEDEVIVRRLNLKAGLLEANDDSPPITLEVVKGYWPVVGSFREM